MALLYKELSFKPAYWDKKSAKSPEQWFSSLLDSTTLYIGNLSYYVTEEQIYETFSPCGTITRVVIGLNQKISYPCGFAFIQFATHAQASYVHSLLNGSICDERQIRCDWDTGKDIMTDRKFGRAVDGGQIRDHVRNLHGQPQIQDNHQ